jgi:hypothetical protein
MQTWQLPLLVSPGAPGQEDPWDSGAAPQAPPRPARHQMSFSDLQQSLRDVNSGKGGDNSFRNNVLVLLALVGMIVLIVHLYRRHKRAAPPDNIHRLGRELGRLVRFPPGTRLLLKWVARSTRTPFASLLLSAPLFDRCIQDWARQPTFSVARQWGRGRLERLRPVLFDEPAAGR